MFVCHATHTHLVATTLHTHTQYRTTYIASHRPSSGACRLCLPPFPFSFPPYDGHTLRYPTHYTTHPTHALPPYRYLCALPRVLPYHTPHLHLQPPLPGCVTVCCLPRWFAIPCGSLYLCAPSALPGAARRDTAPRLSHLPHAPRTHTRTRATPAPAVRLHYRYPIPLAGSLCLFSSSLPPVPTAARTRMRFLPLHL